MISNSATPISAWRLARSRSLTRICRPSSVWNKFEAAPAFSSSFIGQFYQHAEPPANAYPLSVIAIGIEAIASWSFACRDFLYLNKPIVLQLDGMGPLYLKESLPP
jgi:hypothetical protein